ncbi:MAG: hypothetical protein ACQ9MH_02225 [Nitrospinales bacterium]
MTPKKENKNPVVRKRARPPTRKIPPPPKKKKSWIGRIFKSIFILLFILVLLVIGAGVVLQYYFPGETLRPIAEEKLTGILKMPVKIGKIEFNLLQGVQISKVSLGGNEKFVDVGDVRLSYDLSQLIQGKLTINQVSVIKPELNLVSKNGVWNFQPLLGDAESAPPPEPDKKPEDIGFFLPFAVDLQKFIISDISLSAQIDDQLLAHLEGLTVTASGKVGLSNLNADVQVVMEPPDNSETLNNITFLSKEGEGINFRTLLLTNLKLSADSIQSGKIAGTIGLTNNFVKMGEKLPSPDLNIQIEANANMEQQTASLQKIILKIAERNEIDFSAQVANFLGNPNFNFQLNQANFNIEELLSIAGNFIPPLDAIGTIKIAGLVGSGNLIDNQPDNLTINKGEITLKEISASYPDMDANVEGINAKINLNGIKVEKLIPQLVNAAVEFQMRNADVGDIGLRQLDYKLDVNGEGPNLAQANINFSTNLTEASFTHPEFGDLKTPVILNGNANGNFMAGDVKGFQVDFGFGKLANGNISGALEKFGQKKFSLNYLVNAALAKAREYIPSQMVEEIGLEKLIGQVHLDGKYDGSVDKDFMPINVQGNTNVKLAGINVGLTNPALNLKGLDLETSIPANFSSKKGIKIPALKIQTTIKELQAMNNYSVGAVSADTKFSLNKFVSLKEPYGELPIKLDTKILVNSINANDPKISLADLSVKLDADSKISSAKTASNVRLNGNVSLKNIKALDLVATEELVANFKLDVNDLSLTKTRADININIKSPLFKDGDMELGINEVVFKSKSRHNLKDGDINIDLLDLSLPELFGLTAKGHVKNWGEKFSIVSKVPPFRLKSVLAKLPPNIRDQLKGMEMDGKISFNLDADGKTPDDKAIRRMDIPVTLKSSFNIANLNLSWPAEKLNVKNLNIFKKIELKNNTTNFNGSLSVGKITYGDMLGEEGIKPAWNAHLTLDKWDKLTIKKHHLSFEGKGFSETITGRVEGIKDFLSGKRALTVPDILKYLEISISAKNSLEINKAESLIKGLQAKGNFSAQMDLDLMPGEKIEAGGNLEFKKFDAEYEKTGAVKGIDGKLIFSKRLFLDRKLLAAEPKSFSAASKGFFKQLRDFSHFKNIFKIRSAEIQKQKVENIGVDIFFKNDRLVIEKFLMDVLGGSIAGNLFLIQTKEGPTLNFFTEFSGLDFNKLLRDKNQVNAEESEVDGGMQFEFKINQGDAGEKISLDQIKLKISITRIGEETLDRILLFLDPDESKPSIVDLRSKLKLASPHKVIIGLENGNLNLRAWLKAKILGGSIIEAPELKRVPITSMKPFKDAVDQIQMLAGFQDILNYLAAQGIEFDEDGKLVLF